MLALIFECGNVTSSWYAELALRRRVKKAAIGSVMVMAASVTFLAVVPAQIFDLGACRAPVLGWSCVLCGLFPAALLHAGQLARMRHLAQADPAQPELAVDRARATALAATRVATHPELRFACGLVDQCLLSHLLSSP